MSNSNKILSVSVACYNLGEMIVTNIESFCKCAVADKIELIITDDGSKDNTPDIVERYVKKYPNTIKLIRKENEGPGSTVNSGIKNATGKYFKMVDGDDWVNSENLEKFVNFLENCSADLVISDYQMYHNRQKCITKTISYNLIPDKEYDLVNLPLRPQLNMHAATFKTDLLQKNKVKLDNCFYTDTEYLLLPMPYVNKIAYFNYPLYMYRIGQATQSVGIASMKKNIQQHEQVLNHLLNWYREQQNQLSVGQRQVIAKRIADMADAQLTTFLLFEPSKEYKTQIKNFANQLKTEYPDVYAFFKRGKKYRLLRYSNYLLYPWVAKKNTKRLAKEN